MEGRPAPRTVTPLAGGPQRTPSAEPPLFDHIRNLTDRHGLPPCPEDGFPLPDTPPPNTSAALPSVVLDGVRTRHFRLDRDPDLAAELLDLALDVARSGTDGPAARRLVERAAAADVLAAADALSDAYTARGAPAAEVAPVARWLIRNGTRRQVVKLGVVLLGLSGEPSDEDLLLTIGSLGEFTLYAVVALRRLLPAPDRAIAEVARRVHGWGRIHAVTRLSGTDDPEIRAWLLRDGFRNTILDEYLALIAARTGNLLAALSAEPPDIELLPHAVRLLTALFQSDGGPAPGMTAYTDGPAALDRLLALLEGWDGLPSVEMLFDLQVVQRYLAAPERCPDWPPDVMTGSHDRVAAWLARPGLLDVPTTMLRNPDDPGFNLAWITARRFGHTDLPALFRRIDRRPDDLWAWQTLFEAAGDEHIDQAVATAERHLLDGARQDVPGTNNLRPTALETIAPSLRHRPGTGTRLLAAALAGPHRRTRRTACAAVAEWPSEAVPPELRRLMKDVAEDEKEAERRRLGAR